MVGGGAGLSSAPQERTGAALGAERRGARAPWPDAKITCAEVAERASLHTDGVLSDPTRTVTIKGTRKALGGAAVVGAEALAFDRGHAGAAIAAGVEFNTAAVVVGRAAAGLAGWRGDRREVADLADGVIGLATLQAALQTKDADAGVVLTELRVATVAAVAAVPINAFAGRADVPGTFLARVRGRVAEGRYAAAIARGHARRT